MTRRTWIRSGLAGAFALGLTWSSGTARVETRQQTSATAPATRRIISLVPAVTEMLFAIGAGDAVVGVSSYDHYPPAVETKTRVGALVDPDFERILSLKPDLVIVYGTQNDLVARLGRPVCPHSTTSTRGWPTSRRRSASWATGLAGAPRRGAKPIASNTVSRISAGARRANRGRARH
jgi:ABC-type Fe3+-hydroxamate transport system substrate-binding protein